MSALIWSVILNVVVELFFSFCAEDKEKDAVWVELVVDGKPNTEVIVGLDTIVINSTTITNNKGNLFDS